jgi:hypothetical protein
MRIAHEPQMALRHEHRSASVPSISSRILIRPSRTVADCSTSRVYSWKKGAGLEESGLSLLTLRVTSMYRSSSMGVTGVLRGLGSGLALA